MDRGEFSSQMNYIVVTKRLDCSVQRSVFSMQNAAEARERLACVKATERQL